MSNATALKFGYPRTLVAETPFWWVLLRPKQPTFGALVLICKEDATAFSQLSAAAFSDLQAAVGGIERLLSGVVAYQKINYLMLMMLDPAVHFHVVPRYEGVRRAGGVEFPDVGWPGPPALGDAVDLSDAMVDDLTAEWRGLWGAA